MRLARHTKIGGTARKKTLGHSFDLASERRLNRGNVVDGGQHRAINCSGVIEYTALEFLHFELSAGDRAPVVSM